MWILAALPADIWNVQGSQLADLARLVDESARFLSLLQKSANQELNSRRLVSSRQAAVSIAMECLSLCESQADFTEALAAGRLPGCIVPASLPGDIPFANNVASARLWVEALQSVFPPKESWLLQEIINRGMGFIFLEEPYPTVNSLRSVALQELSATRIATQEVLVPPGQNLDLHNSPVDPRIIENENVLFELEASQCIRQKSPVNVGLYHHPVLTAGLQRLFHAEGEATSIGILYTDNSQAGDFPIFRSRSNPGKEQLARAATPLRCALMSMRHLEMDAEVDVAWFQNHETSLKGASSAEIDKQCYEKSIALLSSLPRDELTVLWMYQTGFQPAVVGFYRAVAEILIADSSRIAVLPYIYQASGNYRPGNWWF